MNNWQILREQGTITLVTGTSTYTLASNANVTRIVGERFYMDDGNSFVYKVANNQDFQEFVIQGNTGRPIVWVPWGKNASQVDQIKVDPVPTSDENGKLMTYWYTKDLSDLSADSDTTPFQEVVIRHMVKAKYAEYDQDFAKRDREMALANSLLRKLLGRDRGSVRFVPLTRKNYSVAR
jgi:hypothetical protein|tara:strand:- start:860 stop:1396 length:537 start_codon:yes stop_codon:yes gene_type:complete